jgi:protein-S-isoprenylcysteine O-methyltransferase Ste14
MKSKIGQFFFKTRSYTPIPFLLFIILLAHPTIASLIFGYAFILAGEAVRLWGVGYVGFITRTRNIRAADTLVTNGPYAYMRNPLYLGNFLLSLGVCIALNAAMPWILAAYVILFAIQYYFIIKLEEEALEIKFGEKYVKYKNAVPVFLPVLKSYPEKTGIRFSLQTALRNEKHTFTTIFVMMIISCLFFLFNNPILRWLAF